MRRLLVVVLFAAACQQRSDTPAPQVTVGSGAGSGSAQGVVLPTPIKQRKPAIDIKLPPADAQRTSSGLVFKKLDEVAAGDTAKRNDTVSIVYTGWKQSTGETFFSNVGQPPMSLALANVAPGFTEAIQLMRKGERAMLWLPPAIAFKGKPPPGAEAETLVYEVEVADIQAAPPVPPDLEAPPATATKLPSGTQYIVVRPGTGTDKANTWDTVTFNYSAWSTDGRMFDTTEMRKRPATIAPYRQTPAMEEMLVTLQPGARVRFWVSAERMQQNRPVAGMPAGQLVYEMELLTITRGIKPPPVPTDVKDVPAGAKKTARGVAYKVLRAAKVGKKPTLADVVRVDYSGWTADGRMFDSTVVKGAPQEQRLDGVIVGWQDVLPLMSVGDRWRIWVPAQLAYAGATNKPQGMLVYDVELLDVIAAPAQVGPTATTPPASPNPPDPIDNTLVDPPKSAE